MKLLILTDKLNIGGYDIVAHNLQKNLDPQKFECFYLVRGTEVGPLEQSVIDSGAFVYHQPNDTLSYLKSYNYLLNFFKNHDFDIVHSHLTFYSGIVMKAAYKAGIKKRVSHSHFTDPCIENRSKIKKVIAYCYQQIMRIWLNKYSTDIIGCGQEAGEYLFGKKAFRKNGILLNNGIYTDAISFNCEDRINIRNEFGLNDAYVLGHVGRLNYIKNHQFLIDVFYEFQKEHPNSVLLIVGDGEQKTAIVEKAKELQISEKVIITGVRNDVPALLSAMDCFVFPSLKEGFPLTLVEAQGTKLACLISDTVTDSAKINANVDYLSLNKPASEWAKRVFELISIDRKSVDNTNLITKFDIKTCAQELEQIYLN